jgi:hypothetical protein
MLLHSDANGVPNAQVPAVQPVDPSILVEYIIFVSAAVTLAPPIIHCLPFQATHRPLVKVFTMDSETGVQVTPSCDVAIILLPVTAFPVAKNTDPFQAIPYALERTVEDELVIGVQLIPSYEYATLTSVLTGLVPGSPTATQIDPFHTIDRGPAPVLVPNGVIPSGLEGVVVTVHFLPSSEYANWAVVLSVPATQIVPFQTISVGVENATEGEFVQAVPSTPY